MTTRISLDTEVELSEEEKELLSEALKPLSFVAIKRATAGRGTDDIPFNRESLNITIHEHTSSSRYACNYCSTVAANDEIS